MRTRFGTRSGAARHRLITVITGWRVSLGLARDDGTPLTDEGIDQLTERLSNDPVRPEVTRGDTGAVLVQISVEATDEMSARYAAESTLREAATDVWAALGLPPFTISFIEIAPEAGR